MIITAEFPFPVPNQVEQYPCVLHVTESFGASAVINVSSQWPPIFCRRLYKTVRTLLSLHLLSVYSYLLIMANYSISEDEIRRELNDHEAVKKLLPGQFSCLENIMYATDDEMELVMQNVGLSINSKANIRKIRMVSI